MNFQESTTILNAHTKVAWKHRMHFVYAWLDKNIKNITFSENNKNAWLDEYVKNSPHRRLD